MSKLLASLMRNYFPKRPSGAPLHTLSKLYDVPVGFVTPPYFEAVYAYFAVAKGWLLLDIGWFVLYLRKFYGRYGDLIKQYEVSLSQMLNDILWPDHIQWQPPTDQTLYRTRPFTEFWVVSIEHLRRVWHADRGRLLLRTPGPVPLGLAYVLLVETNPFPNLSLFYWTMLFEYPSVLSRFCSQLSQLRKQDATIQITHAEHNRESDYLFSDKYF